MSDKRVVITGVGLISPLGHTIDDFTNNLRNGVSCADFITHFDASKFKTKFACEVKDFNPADKFDRKELRKLDLFAVYAMAAADNAMADSGLDLTKINDRRCGVILASGIGGIKTFEDEIINYTQGDGTPRFSPFFIPKMIIDLASGHISMKYGLRGINFATVSACASSNNAMGAAFDYIRLGKADLIVTGGAEAAISPSAIGGFTSMKALSERNDDPKTASRPFDVDRDGFVMGEGSVVFVMEDYEHAKKRGAHIYAEMIGAGYSADAYHMTAPHPDGLGATYVMENCLEDAKLNPQDVDYINVHGTSTPLGDISETRAIRNVFKDQAYNLNISSTKSMHGHLLGGAGAIEALACIVGMNNDFVPPTINLQNLDPEIDPKLNLTTHGAQERKFDISLSNTFGFGGHNVCLAFKKFS